MLHTSCLAYLSSRSALGSFSQQNLYKQNPNSTIVRQWINKNLATISITDPFTFSFLLRNGAPAPPGPPLPPFPLGFGLAEAKLPKDGTI